MSNHEFSNTGIEKNNLPGKVNKVEVLPNPVATYATFKYSLSLINSAYATLSVFNVEGRAINKFILNDKEGSLIWNTIDVLSGLYYYIVKDGDLKIAQGKIIVKK